MAGAPFNSLPLYTAATTTTATPPPPTPPEPPTTTLNPTPTIPTPHQPQHPPPLTPTTTTTTNTTAATCFRLLCHSSRIGGVIGKSGSVIKHLQNATSAKIRIEHAPQGSEYRIITVVADSLITKTMSFDEECDEETYSNSNEYTEVSDAQEALVRVFERILSVAAETDGCYNAPGGVVSCKLLMNKMVVGCVIGKGGKVVEKIKRDTGCNIRVLSQERLPGCAKSVDEMIEIEGRVVAVKRALIAVARRVQDCPPPEKARVAFGKPDNRLQNGHMDRYPQVRPHNGFNPMLPNRHVDHFSSARPQNGFNPLLPNRHMDHFPLVQEPAPTISGNYASGGRGFGQLGGETSSTRSFQNQQIIAFRMLCSGDLVAGVIGNGGTIVRAFENQTGASISIAYPVPGVDDRLITITANESPESQNSAAQNAVILVFGRCVEMVYAKGSDSPSSGTPVCAKLVIPNYQTGCLLGKGGSVMEDMRKVTGAFIRIVSGNNFPGCASETDEVVLMKGEFVNVRDALYSVTTRLRNHLFTSRNKTHRRTIGQPTFESHSSLTQSMDNLRLSNNVDHSSSSGPWQSQAGARNMMNGHDVDRGSTSGKGGSGIELGRGGRSAIITNTTVEIMVPKNDIGCVYGENGSNLTRLIQISGAKVVVHEPGSRNGDYVIVISGTPDQTQSAQSLLQAFMLADQH
ncbi:putative K domain-containing protein [Helianthus debilis subsp. tardiflorus]